MPLVSEFYGIKIYMYWDDHSPPHFHAEFGEYKILVKIVDSVVLKGTFPSKQLRLVLAWSAIHEADLLQNWELALEHNKIQRIEPLQ